MKRNMVVRALLAGSALFIGSAAVAQATGPEAQQQPGAGTGQTELEQLRAQVHELLEWKAATEAAQAAAAQAEAERAQHQPAQPRAAQTQAGVQTEAVPPVPAATPAAESGGSRVNVSLYGSVQLDGIYDFHRMDPTWAGAFRPSKIATTPGAYGDNGQSLFSARQTLFGISGSGDVAGNPLRVSFEFDLFGNGANAGETTFHLQRASAEWGPLLFGYDKTLFMDSDLFPNIIDYWGPAGMIYVKNSGIRFTAINNDHYYFGVSLELPGNDVDPGLIRIIDPGLASTLTSSQKLPDLIAAGRISGDWGYVRLAGLIRRVGFETIGTPGGEPNGGELGWGLNLTTALKPTSTTTIRLGGVIGQGIASYFNDGGTDLVPVLASNLTVHAAAADIFGVTAYLEQAWNDQFTSAIGFSRARLDNSNLQTGDAFHIGDYASANLLYKPHPNLLIGGELLYGRREDNNGASGEDVRFQLSLRYSYNVNLVGSR